MLTIRRISDADDSTNSALLQFATKYEKPLMLLLIPMMAICSYISFNRRKFNFAEHLIISGYVFAGYLLITTAGVILCFFNLFDQNFIEDLVTNIERVLSVLYIAMTSTKPKGPITRKLSTIRTCSSRRWLHRSPILTGPVSNSIIES